ncbi:MAG: IS110 family transposase, partial [Acetobacteraceae bacterium]|nr:IS110 family transposase [Acetobacteraceae bacterium]
PGVSALSAAVIVAEVGTDISRFPSATHLISWAGLCPRSDESAGKRRSTRLAQGGAVAEDPARADRLVRGPRQRHLPAGPLRAPQGAPRPAQGHHRRRRGHPDRRLLDPPSRRRLRRPRRGPLRPDRADPPRRPPRPQAR